MCGEDKGPIMKRKWLKLAVCVIGTAVILMLAINLTTPEKLIRLRIDSAGSERIEYAVVSWSIRPFTTGILDENITLFKQMNGDWIFMRNGEYLRHDIGFTMRPFCRVSSAFIPDDPLEPGTYKLGFHYNINGRGMDAETMFEME